MKKNRKWLTAIISLLIVCIYLMPFYILTTIAFKKKTDLSSKWFLPKYLYLDNFKEVIQSGHILRGIFNTAIITFFSVIIIVFVGALAAYPLSRIKGKFNKMVLNIVLGVMMIPPLSVLVPVYTTMIKIKGVNSFWGIILVLSTFQLPLSIFLYSNFLSTIPRALEEAAYIDGCNKFNVYFRIILPLVKPVTASVVILTGLNVWNDYSFSLYLLQKTEMKNITLTVSSFFSQYSSNLNAAAAGSILAILPIVIVYICLQKYFIQGTIDSAVK